MGKDAVRKQVIKVASNAQRDSVFSEAATLP